MRERYEAFAAADLLRTVADLIPQHPARIADIGAGTGRDAAWLAHQGHHVTAVEPSRRMREIGAALHGDAGVAWRDDALPDLPGLTAAASRFDLILSIGVWHHLCAADRARALAVLAGLLRPAGVLILRVRSGPSPADRPGWTLPVADSVYAAQAVGLTLIRQSHSDALQPANRALGVTWTWLAFRAGP